MKSEEFGRQKSPNVWNIPRNTYIQTGFVYFILSIYVSLDITTWFIAFVALVLEEKHRLFLFLYTTVTPQRLFSHTFKRNRTNTSSSYLRERIKASRKQTILGDSVCARLTLIADDDDNTRLLREQKTESERKQNISHVSCLTAYSCNYIFIALTLLFSRVPREL